MAITTIPVTIPYFSPHYYPGNNGSSHFIEAYDDRLININAAHECGVYESYGDWWIWFKINGNTKYYKYTFDTKEEALDQLKKFLN
jgi:hypothetical protein